MALKIDVMLAPSVVEAPERARALEKTGVDGVFSFENAHDLFFPLVAAAPVCSLDLLTNVAIAFPRSPMHLAHAAYDLQLLSHGRFRLGLGTQVRAHVEKRFGARWDKPVKQMREWVSATKSDPAELAGRQPPGFPRRLHTHTLMTPAFNPGPNPYGIPKVLVGALGPRMNEMAAEVADGILVMPFNSARHMRERTVPAIERGLSTAGRNREDIEVTAEVIVGAGPQRRGTRRRPARVKFLLAFYGSTPAYQPGPRGRRVGAVQPELNAMSKRGEWAGMAELITDEMMHTIAVHGTPEQVAEEIVRRYGDCVRICAYFPGYDAIRRSDR